MTSCAIAGHHPTRFKFKYKETNNGCKRLKKRLHDQIIALYEQGVRRFYISGTLGVGIWTGEILLRLKELPEYHDIDLIVVLPFNGNDSQWDERSQKRMAFLIQHSNEVIVTGDLSIPSYMNYRRLDMYMVDHADCLLAVYDNVPTTQDRIGRTVHRALSRNLTVICIHPDNCAVSRLENVTQIEQA